MQRVNAVRDFLDTADGANLLAAYRRAANILRIEDAKDGPHTVGSMRRSIRRSTRRTALLDALAAGSGQRR